jgi:hypothetical protein
VQYQACDKSGAVFEVDVHGLGDGRWGAMRAGVCPKTSWPPGNWVWLDSGEDLSYELGDPILNWMADWLNAVSTRLGAAPVPPTPRSITQRDIKPFFRSRTALLEAIERSGARVAC